MRLHGTERWRRLAKLQLRMHPLCALCEPQGRITAAQVADHVIPHHNDATLFWQGALQSLCLSCHNRTKKVMEAGGRITGADGWPLGKDNGHDLKPH